MQLTSTSQNLAPSGAVVEELRAVDGVRLRAARWAPKREPRGTVVVVGGRAEFIEKYFETAGDLLDRGFCVAALDWRGQGGSERQLANRDKHHIDDFSLYERDLAAFVKAIVAPHCPKPHFAIGHSMGAAILLMIAHSGRLPFERVVLSSPMIAIANLRRPRLTRAAIEALDFVGLGGAFAPGGGNKPIGLQPFEGNPLTSDPVRFARMASALRAEPALGVGWPTIGWLHAAFRLMGQFADPNYPREILNPILVVASGADRVTDVRACERFSERLRAGRIVVVEGARHELLIERDVFRDQFWAAFDAFVPGSEPSLRA
jgi:lysophospholipase